MTELVASWLETLRSRTAAGRSWRNVHVVREPLNTYLRYAFEWGYANNQQAGQDIRVLSTDNSVAGRLVFEVGDFWVVDHSKIVLMHYAEDGSFVGASRGAPEHFAVYAGLAEMLWESATPFFTWWSARPQYHRDPGSVSVVE